ncbi:MAG: leucyl aminopeptidase family protein [Hyphomicrobiales bacterium]|nr:leucyl aminopeptidase family protein [Hyphomicrobiales bacterium]
MSHPIGDPTGGSIPILLTTRAGWPQTRARLAPAARAFAAATGFDGAPGAHLLAPDVKGGLAAVLFGVDAADGGRANPFLPGKLAGLLPPGRYRFEGEGVDAHAAALGYLLSAYRFGRYRKPRAAAVTLELPRGPARARIEAIAAAVTFGRDLINTPTNDLGPDALEKAATALARKHGARTNAVRGADLLKRNFPLVHAVGKGASEAPRILDVKWGAKGPKVTLVGKGVCFDTGGLDLKPSAAMLLMKKDMGGAATALAAASMIMQAELPVRLRIILPIVENSVSAASFRPGDVYPSRAGLTVEIGNTDAEGRLILADALALADADEPDLLFDFATLTGAARVALGPDLPALFCGDDALAAEIAAAGAAAADPVWRLPLWAPYDGQIESKVADLNNVAGGPFAGAIVAALFLQRFVRKSRGNWAHFDVYNWNQRAMPARPEGGDIQAARLVFELLQRRVGGLAPRGKRAK